jgi:hypothetical protein
VTRRRLRWVSCRMAPFTPALAIVLAVVLFSACGTSGDGTAPSTSGGGAGGGTGDAADGGLVLQVSTTGGMPGPGVQLGRVPELSLYADGTLITPGVQIAIFPPPMLPALQRTTVPPGDVDAVLAAARAAGLTGGGTRELPVAGGPQIADAPSTTVTVTADGRTTVTSAYALGLEGGGVSAERRELGRFVTAVQDGSLLDVSSGDAGDTALYEPTAIAIRTREADPTATDDTPEFSDPDGIVRDRVDWTVPQVSLADATEPDGCIVLRDADLAAALPVLEQANTLTLFVQDGRFWEMAVRPLLPDETDCPN